MNKKIILGLLAVVVVAGGVAGMSAYEAHVINVTAHIENALYVHPEAIVFGTVFPQEYLERDFTVELSTSFQGQDRVDYVDYVIKQKPKCKCDIAQPTGEECPDGTYAPVGYDTHECPTGYSEMENLCQFLSKVDADQGDDNDISHPSYYNDPTPGEPNSGDESCAQPVRYENTLSFNPTGWAGWSCPLNEYAVGAGVLVGDANVYLWQPGATTPGGIVYPNTGTSYVYGPGETGMIIQNDGDENESITYYVDCMTIVDDASGILSILDDDVVDLWKVDLKVPPVDGFVGQDWPAGCPTVPTNDIDYGCDLWIEVTGIGTPY